MIKNWIGCINFRCFILLVVIFAGSGLSLEAVDQTDPAAISNYALALIRVNDCDGLLEIMVESQKKEYQPFTTEKREKLTELLKTDSEKIGDALKVTELKECKSLSGNPGVAAKVRKKGDEIVVIILAKENDMYFYENILSLTIAAYKDLKLITKLK